MKTKVQLEYDYEDPVSREMADRIMNADEAWSALWKINILINEAVGKSDNLDDLWKIKELVDETRLMKVWK